MKNLLAALVTKMSGSALSSDVGGRMFLDQAPEGTEYPYIVYSIISAPKDKTFTEVYRDTLIQFSIFSNSESTVEVTGIYSDLSSLFDECSLTITGSKLIWMKETNLVTMVEEADTATATPLVRHWAVDYEINTVLN